jgi:hypothetical protein
LHRVLGEGTVVLQDIPAGIFGPCQAVTGIVNQEYFLGGATATLSGKLIGLRVRFDGTDL